MDNIEMVPYLGRYGYDWPDMLTVLHNGGFK